MPKVFRITLMLATIAMCGGVPAAHAQTGFDLLPPADGDCDVRVRVPNDADIRELALFIDGVMVTTRPARKHGDVARMRLSDPLRENDVITVQLSPSMTTPPARVQQAKQQDVPPRTSCAPRYKDDRGVFEASAYLGEAFDNFSPAETKNYIGTPPASDTNSRWLAGVETQYRLIGGQGNTFQIWLGSYTLHGVRSADIDCRVTPSSPLCQQPKPTNELDRFLAVIEHASSLEAHFDTRVEFWTLQKASEMPIKAFALARFGFVDVTGAPKVFNADALGVGVTSPSGPFRNSSAIVAWGRSEQFQSDPRWNRLKVSGNLVFDVVPNLTDTLEFWKRLAGSPRAFVAIMVDRNPGGGSPDSVVSYVGIDFDLRRLFYGWGG